MFISLFEKKEKVSLLIDIGNGSVSGALVKFKDGEKPALLYGTRAEIPVGQKPDNDKLQSSMNTLLGEVLSSVIKKGFAVSYFKKNKKQIASVLVSFSSPWFVAKTKNLHLVQKTPFVITKKFIDNVLDVERKNFEKGLSGGEYENDFGDDLRMIENIIVQTKINGYFIKDSIGKKTKTFDASLYISVISKSVVDGVYKEIFKHTHMAEKNVRVHTFPLVAFSVVRDLFPASESFLLLDITSETTDITLVLNDVIVKTISFPSGRNFVIRQIAKKFGVSAEIAESFLHMRNSKETDNETEEKISNVLSEVEKEWSIYFADAFLELSKNSVLPAIVYMTAENDIEQIYGDFMKIPKTDETSVFRKNVQIINLNENILSGSYVADKRFPPDQFIGILGAFFNKVEKI